MKVLLPIALVTIGLSSLVWVFFYIQTPEAPLTTKDMVFVVAFFLLVALSMRWLWNQWKAREQSGAQRGNRILAIVIAGVVLLALSVTSLFFFALQTRVLSPLPAPAPPEAYRETGRAFLIGARNEECGYGLYSYLLLGSAPSQKSRQRYLAALRAFLLFAPRVKDLERSNVPLRAINITYLPVLGQEMQTYTPPDVLEASGDSPLINDLADWVLLNYNYPRARAFLNTMPAGPYLDGPYFVSTLKPLTGVEAITEEYLFQDLSSVPAEIIGPWIKEFFNQSAQEHFWEGRNAAQFALMLRKNITILAMASSEANKAWPEARKAIENLIGWKERSLEVSQPKKK